MTKLTINDCIELAKSKGGQCLSDVYVGYKTKMLWKCNKDHHWYTTLDGIKNKNAWCPECSYIGVGNRYRFDGIKIANQLAIEKHGKCLSTEYTNMHTKLLWECKKGHQWERSLSKIKHRSQWCPYCCKRPPLSINDCMVEANKRGGKCLSTEYTSCEEKLLWECSDGHQWKAIFRSIRLNKSWCPECNNYSKNQDKLTEILENELKLKSFSNFRGFGWLKNPDTKRKLEIDIW
ncbi:hypothetical protein LCGC14_3098700, partial [marine sediment metagenome]